MRVRNLILRVWEEGGGGEGGGEGGHTIPRLRLSLRSQIIDREFDIMPLFETGLGLGF